MNFDLKELEALIKLCRKSGVTSITVDGTAITLAPQAPESPYKRRTKKPTASPFEAALSQAKDEATVAKLKYLQSQHEAKELEKTTTGPSELDLLYWSSGQGDNAESGNGQ